MKNKKQRDDISMLLFTIEKKSQKMPERHHSEHRHPVKCEFIVEDALWNPLLPTLEKKIPQLFEKTVDIDDRHLFGQVAILLTQDQKMVELNQQWMAKKGATDILSFPATDVDLLTTAEEFSDQLGDLVLAYDYVQKQSVALGLELRDHIFHLLVHGFLHLIGYRHDTHAARDVMQDLERQVLETKAIERPYNLL